MTRKTLLITGASGKLGNALQTLAWDGYTLLTPDRNELCLTDYARVAAYFASHKIDAVIHCAALTDMKKCETDPSLAVAVNIGGTAHVVRALLTHYPGVRIIYLSTDYVYPSAKGPYNEHDAVKPFNLYALTKFGGECVVQAAPNHCIIRTSFFNPDYISFDSAPADAFCSKISFREGAEAVQFLLDNDFRGIINVGQNRISLYELLHKHRADIRPVTLDEINRTAPVRRAPDSSLDVALWKKVRGAV